MKRKIKITIEYDGTNYSGWQIQPDQISVQQKIEEALKALFNDDVKIHGAGRTDAGVHALGQVAHFELDADIPSERIKYAINTKLPKDIRIVKSEEADIDFHARYNAKGKVYRFQIHNADIPSAIFRNNRYHVRQILDVEKMIEAGAFFLGVHEFSAFCGSGTDVDNKVREIYRIDIVKRGNVIELEFQGSGFLYHMIRIMVGTLIDVGKGKIKPQAISEIILSGDRCNAGATAGGCGLCLVRVLY